MDKLTEIFVLGVAPGKNVKFEADLLIPANAINSNREFCDIIEVKYEFKVEAIVAGCHMNIETIVPITILSVPLRSSEESTTLNDNSASQPSAPPMYDLRKFARFFSFSMQTHQNSSSSSIV